MELVNLVNENNALQKDFQAEVKVKGDVTQARQYLEMRSDRMDKELAELRQELTDANAEINRLRLVAQQNEVARDRDDVELGNRKMELERQFLEINNQRALEID